MTLLAPASTAAPATRDNTAAGKSAAATGQTDRQAAKGKDRQGVPAAKTAAGAAAAPFSLVDAGDGKRIAFVCDASGSMINYAGDQRSAMENAVNSLKPDQSFLVAFFANDTCQTYPRATSWAPADAKNKKAVRKWMADVVTFGTSNPLPALDVVFRHEPDVVYFASDDLAGNKVAERLKVLNTDKRVRINTIAYAGNLATEYQPQFYRQMRDIAAVHGGRFRLAGEDDPTGAAAARAGPDSEHNVEHEDDSEANAPLEIFIDLGDAHSVAFVCDASGSMHTGKWPRVRSEMTRVIRKMGERDRFSVVCFRAEQVVSYASTLVLANARNKRNAVAWLREVSASGVGDPVPALRIAAGQRPQLMYVVVDELLDARAALQTVWELNRNNKTRINTILFLSHDAYADPSAVLALRLMSSETGGNFRLLRMDRKGNRIAELPAEPRAEVPAEVEQSGVGKEVKSGR
jgi:Mg-chelatase subunit ChlD